MADQDKKEIIKNPEKPVSSGEQHIAFKPEGEQAQEKNKISPDDERVSAELRREIEMMQIDDKAKVDVEKTKEKIEYLGEKEKIEHLLQIAREKGLVFAIQIAKKMNEPYLLDVLHDTLAREGFYQKIMQNTDDDSQTAPPNTNQKT